MKLSQWRQINHRTQAWVAEQIGVSQSFISLIERAQDPQTPNADVMRALYILTHGQVQPNDFYDVPAWQAELIRKEAEAALARKAA